MAKVEELVNLAVKVGKGQRKAVGLRAVKRGETVQAFVRRALDRELKRGTG